ncbi:MAG: PAS domain-containing protein [Chromatiales bacterium]|nr:PAS domain-containing protein [Chromatiales bacterium]
MSISPRLKYAKQALEAEKERFRGIFEQTGSGVAVYQPVDGGGDFIFTDYNAAAERMDQTMRQDVIGRRLTGVFSRSRRYGAGRCVAASEPDRTDRVPAIGLLRGQLSSGLARKHDIQAFLRRGGGGLQ